MAICSFLKLIIMYVLCDFLRCILLPSYAKAKLGIAKFPQTAMWKSHNFCAKSYIYSVVYFPHGNGNGMSTFVLRAAGQSPLNPCCILTIHRAVSGRLRVLHCGSNPNWICWSLQLVLNQPVFYKLCFLGWPRSYHAYGALRVNCWVI